MKILTKVLVGSRLHGLHTEASDYDYRGIHISPLKEVLSPFSKLKNTNWIEGDEDNTSYELADFCKNATKGNATILEVFFSDKIIETTPVAEEMRDNWTKFMDTHHFVNASRGYAHNQWNKFYNFEDQGVKGQERTSKFAVAFLRVMWQCEQFLLTGKFICDISQSDIYPLLKKIKPLSAKEIQPYLPEIVAAMSDMNMRVSVAESKTKFGDMKPDIKWIEDFIYRSYMDNIIEDAVEDALWHERVGNE
ncbi:COG3541 Predicted nucleotidyltransferase [uncultured Caudovirales phage]|uniref:COG3541 Predicted nucleotidyltransferase n=1 Tax=uncultured Caudovirales phage TaxID=2100421 RepID=A0A6J5QTP6_9CAUD|nr:COG3541 Predicted nucleotidyltransferase [uncultured Caudovirales phage]CAB4212891.1 COG3541 Predicted nucleotidyltransferase [uncultured Caudovirales phage]